MSEQRKARALLAVRLGDRPLVDGADREASPKGVIAAALARLAELRRQRAQEAGKRDR